MYLFPKKEITSKFENLTNSKFIGISFCETLNRTDPNQIMGNYLSTNKKIVLHFNFI